MEDQNPSGINPFKEPQKYQETIVDLMKKCELLIGELYGVYAEKFPEHKDFWMKLHDEEEVHSYWLETLSLHSGNNDVYFNEKRFNMAPIKGFIEHVSNNIERAKGEMTILEALAASNDIEQGMIENKYFEIFEGDSAEFKKTMFNLEKETMDHAERVKEFLEKERK